MQDLIGQSLGRYHITEKLGEGGMASVYKAFDMHLDCDVAVKVIRTDQLAPAVMERALKRFEREAKAVAKLTHANIVKVTDYGEFQGYPYIVMEYLPGGTLKQYIQNHGKLNWKESIRILTPVAEALEYAHEQNLIHRDVKPSNILLTAKSQPMLTDFGVAKIIDEEATQDLTGTSATVGTPEYMAPEQVISKTVDHRADIYSLGVVFYEMVTGRRPFEADTPMAVLFKHAGEPLPRPTIFVIDLPENIEQVLLKILAKKPDERYQSMAEVIQAFEMIMASNQRQQESYQLRVNQDVETNIHPEKMADNDTFETRIELSETGLKSRTNTEIDVDLGNGIQNVETNDYPEKASNGDAFETRIESGETAIKPHPTNEIKVDLGDGINMEFICIPAGKFLMGSDPEVDLDAENDEMPQHEVFLSEYLIGKYSVTNEQFQQFALNSSDLIRQEAWTKRTIDSFERHPVVDVTWADANAFCDWLSKKVNRMIQLPTEAQWEKAARGTDGSIYPWSIGKDFDRYANYEHSKQKTTPVGNYPEGASPYGILDMAGNVWEWTADWYQETYYDNSPINNPQGPHSGDYRILRGGSWSSSSFYLRAACRLKKHPSELNKLTGFRCALSATVSP